MANNLCTVVIINDFLCQMSTFYKMSLLKVSGKTIVTSRPKIELCYVIRL